MNQLFRRIGEKEKRRAVLVRKIAAIARNTDGSVTQVDGRAVPGCRRLRTQAGRAEQDRKEADTHDLSSVGDAQARGYDNPAGDSHQTRELRKRRLVFFQEF